MCLFVYFSIDATETECLEKYANAKMKLIMGNEIPALCLFVGVVGIKVGTALRYFFKAFFYAYLVQEVNSTSNSRLLDGPWS